MPLGENRLAPLGFMEFCLRKPQRCAATDEIRQIPLNAARSELERVNREANRNITPRVEPPPPDKPPWNDEATAGDCEEYVLAKRSRLLNLGYPPSALLIAEATIPSGKGHLVLVVVSDQGDFVLDNLQPEVIRWDKLPYNWLMRSTSKNPKYWQAISSLQAFSSLDGAPSAETAKRCLRYSYLAYPYKRPGSVRMSGDRQAYFRDCMAKDGNVPDPTTSKARDTFTTIEPARPVTLIQTPEASSTLAQICISNSATPFYVWNPNC